MNCLDIAAILDESDLSQVSGAERRDIDAHLAQCAECRAAVAAHDAMNGMTVPAMSESLEDRCRRLVAAQSVGRARRAGGRPFVVVGLLVAGAAAATFIGVQIVDGTDESLDPAAEAVVASESTPDTSEPLDVQAAAGEATASPESADRANAAAAGGFTVAVEFQQSMTSALGVQMSESVYRAFLDELRKIPGLELIEIEADAAVAASAVPVAGVVEFTPAPGGVAGFEPADAGVVGFAPTAAGVVEISPPGGGAVEFNEPVVIETSTSAVNLGGLRDGDVEGSGTLVLVDSSRFVASNSNGTVDINTIPTALVGRIETVTGGASATYRADAVAGVVNVILDNNIEGMRVDMNYSTSTAEPLPYDYMLVVSTSEQDDALSLTVLGRSDGNSSSYGGGFPLDEPFAFQETIESVVAAMRDTLFPVDPALLAAIEHRVLDSSIHIDSRLREFSRLQRLNSRSGNVELSSDVALAIADMASRITDPRQRARLWQQLDGMQNAALIQPLQDSLRNDANDQVRLAAVGVLAGFPQDSVARAALETAASVDASPAVRNHARWATLDTAGRRDLVVSTLLDTRLDDGERIGPLVQIGGWAGIDRVDLGPAVNSTVVNELTALLRRQEQPDMRVRLLSRLEMEESPALTPLFLERLSEDGVDVVRANAASALARRLDEPGVRSALERAAAQDPLPNVRAVAAGILERGF